MLGQAARKTSFKISKFSCFLQTDFRIRIIMEGNGICLPEVEGCYECASTKFPRPVN